MFKNNKKQYINILRQLKQLKIDYTSIQNDKVIKQENSTFIQTTDSLPQDAIVKLDILQKDITNSYISSLYTNGDQLILPKENKDLQQNEIVHLGDEHIISIAKENLDLYKRYFQNSGIDYIFSPFTILYNTIENRLSSNSINILIIENKLFIIIVNKDKKLVKFLTKVLTDFNNIQDSNFYTDDIIGQKLYDEVHSLEIQQTLSDIIEEYYNQNDGVDFFSQLNIYYSIKQLNDEQLDLLHESLMLEVLYNPINIDEHIYKLSQKINATEYSFISPRNKKNKNTSTLWLSILLLSTLVVGGTLYYKVSQDIPESKEIKPSIKTIKDIQKVKVEKVIKLPNHTYLNNKIVEQTLMLFNIIPYDAVLQELKIRTDKSTFVTIFLADSTTATEVQNKLKQIYEDSKIILKHKNNAILSTIIENTKVIDKKTDKNIVNKIEYQKYKFVDSNKFTKYLSIITPKDTKIKFMSQNKGEFLTYNFELKSSIKTPKDFFNIIEKLNKKDVPINLIYPLEFAKTKNGIMITYNLQFHQLNK